MAEPVAAWWERRRFSRGTDVPYEPGRYADAWAPYPVLQRQYLPHLNAGLLLTQIPPAAEVLLLWQCTAGHRFAATPAEQRSRPGRVRRRSAWCPECTAAARPPVVRARDAPRRERPRRRLCSVTPPLPVGTAFASACAPRPASAAESDIRAALHTRLAFTAGVNAVRVSRPFFEHLEVWPDILIPELRVAIEYDTIGRFGLEHVGDRETADRRKDRVLRAAGWEVVRLRTAPLQPLGSHDLRVTTFGRRDQDAVLRTLRALRGDAARKLENPG
jgi:hypothetical protein